jgi:hypothetical protein
MTGKVGSALIQRYNAFVEMSKNLATGSGFSNGSPGVGVGVCEAPAWLAHSAWQRPARLHPYRFASAMNEPRQPGTSTADPLGSRRRPSSRRHAGPTHHQSGPHAQGASASSRVDAVPLDPVGRDHWRPGRRPVEAILADRRHPEQDPLLSGAAAPEPALWPGSARGRLCPRAVDQLRRPALALWSSRQHRDFIMNRPEFPGGSTP